MGITDLMPLMTGIGVGFGLLLMILAVGGDVDRLATKAQRRLSHGGSHRFVSSPIEERAERSASEPEAPIGGQWRLRAGVASAAAIGLYGATGWLVIAALGAFVGYLVPTFRAAARHRRHSVAQTEGVAVWAEQLRDTIAAASGLQEAIAVTAPSAPQAIRGEVLELAAGMRRNPLGQELRHFAHRVDDPVADQVAVALVLASEHRGQNLTGVLSDIARTAQEESAMRARVEVSRARAYSDARAVTAVVVVMFIFLLTTSREYLQPFDTSTGQLVLAAVAAGWGGAVWALLGLSVLRRPPRILGTDLSAGRGGEG